MATKLDKPIRRELLIDGELYTILISDHGLRLTKKRFRSGVALSWKALLRQSVPVQQAPSSAPREPA